MRKPDSSAPLLGVIGGMGIRATACFYEMLYKKQNVTAEQELLDVIIYSTSGTPDRTAFITGKSSDSPLNSLLHAAESLVDADVSLLTMLCITAHYFYDDLKGAVSVPFLSIPEETLRYITGRGISRVGLLATDGTLKGRVFHTAFEKAGIEIITPPETPQADLMKIIYDIKAGSVVLPEKLDAIAGELRKNGAEAIILGCTDLCIDGFDSPDYINTLEVLAEAVLKL